MEHETKQLHGFRVEDSLWDEVKELAQDDGGLAEVLRDAMRTYRERKTQEGRDHVRRAGGEA